MAHILVVEDMVGDRDKALAAGFDGYIAKPIEPEVLESQVKTFL